MTISYYIPHHQNITNHLYYQLTSSQIIKNVAERRQPSKDSVLTMHKWIEQHFDKRMLRNNKGSAPMCYHNQAVCTFIFSPTLTFKYDAVCNFKSWYRHRLLDKYNNATAITLIACFPSLRTYDQRYTAHHITYDQSSSAHYIYAAP